jgi:transcriptional regulator with XRE-family HTH domain
MKFKDRLKELRKEKELLQKDVAEKLGIARNTYCGYELGNREPDLQMLIKMAEYFDCSLDYLIGLTNFKHEKDCEEYTVAVELLKEKNISPKKLKELIFLIQSLEQ